MKKYILQIISIAVIAVLGFSSCVKSETESVFDESVNQRFEKMKGEYIKVLSSAENGWIGYYAPNNKVGGFAILMKFDDKGNVKMASDFYQGKYDNTSTYRIDKKLKVELVFESATVLSKIYETNFNNVDGEYVFNIDSVANDMIKLSSATDFGYDGSGITELILVRAKPENWSFESVYENTPKLANGYKTNMYFREMVVEGTNIKKSFSYVDGYNSNMINRYAIIKGFNDKGGIDVNNVSIAITSNGFKFINPYTINGKQVSNFTYDEANNIFVSNDGGQKTLIRHTAQSPVIYYPEVSIGADDNPMELLYRQYLFWPTIQSESSPDFLAIYKASRVSRFYFELNEELDGTMYPMVLWITHPLISIKPEPYNYIRIPFNIERVPNNKFTLKPIADLSSYISNTTVLNDIKKLYDVLVDPNGFHVESKEISTLFGPYEGYFFIGTVNSNIRFPVMNTGLK